MNYILGKISNHKPIILQMGWLQNGVLGVHIQLQALRKLSSWETITKTDNLTEWSGHTAKKQYKTSMHDGST